jgi:Na+(H+)/acetate symporter ActP
VASAGLLAGLTPVGAWTLLVLAVGLAASALAPAAVLACWSERAAARGVTAGAGAGLAVFLLVAVGGAADPSELWEGWGSAATLAPVFAAPVHGLVAWLLRSQRAASQRSPLPPGLDGLSAPLPVGPRAG